MRQQPLDLGPESVACTARYHGTPSAVRRVGCTCPSAREAKRAYDRQWRWQPTSEDVADIDALAVAYAIQGSFTAEQLTTAERHQVVRHLAVVEGMADRKIALYLRWGRDVNRAKEAVCRFRLRHNIPAAAPSGRRDWSGVAA